MRTILNILSKRGPSATNTTKMRTKRYLSQFCITLQIYCQLFKKILLNGQRLINAVHLKYSESWNSYRLIRQRIPVNAQRLTYSAADFLNKPPTPLRLVNLN